MSVFVRSCACMSARNISVCICIRLISLQIISRQITETGLSAVSEHTAQGDLPMYVHIDDPTFVTRPHVFLL
jgi:hypothetical protein